MKYILVISLLLILTCSAWAQPRPPGGGRPPCWPPSQCIPVDGGVVALITAGLLIGNKAIKRSELK